MSNANFKGVVKKVNLKPKGVQEIVIEVSGNELRGQLDRLAQMVDGRVCVDLESLIVNYNLTINANTKEPLTEYKVDEKGVVSEVKKAEQMELPGMPKQDIKIEEEPKQVNREVVDEFILNDLAPQYDDMPAEITQVVKRRLEGESYSKLASDLDMSSGKIVDLIDEYRTRIAPLAEKWWEWKEGNESPNQSEDEGEDEAPESDQDDESEEGAA